MDDKRIPKIRFSGFTDEWEQRRLFEVAEFNPKSELPDEFEYVDLESVVGTEMVSHRTETKSSAPSRAQRLARTGDVFYQTVRPYQKNNYLFSKPDNNYVFSTGYAQMRPNIDAEFLMSFLQTEGFVKLVLDNCTGTSYPAINTTDLSNLIITLPSSGNEQTKIGQYMIILDHLIILHQRKCYNLKELRDGIIQRIFSRELRFKRADGREFENWVTKALSEIFTERKVSQTITEDAPLLSFTIEQGVINPQDKKTNKRDFLIKDKDTKKFALTEVDDIIYNPANLKYGAIHRNKLMRGVVSPIYAIFYTEQNPAFMEYVVKSPIFIKNSMKYLEGTVIKLMTLKPRDFLKLKVEIPASLEEQKIIANFLMKFDETIDAEQKKIEKWKELKKGLLQQMFV